VSKVRPKLRDLPRLRALAVAAGGGVAAGLAGWLIHAPDPVGAGVLIFAGILIGATL